MTARPVASILRSWRSLLFVPADDRRRWEKAHQRGADAVILDLEDAVAPDAKAAARAQLAEAIEQLANAGAPVVVRINQGAEAEPDLAAAVRPGLAAVMAPKVEDVAALTALIASLRTREAAAGLPNGSIALIALIETPLGLERLLAIADCAGVTGLALGVEDFGRSLGVEPSAEALDLPCRLIALAAASRGQAALAAPASIARFDRPDLFGEAAARGRAMGATGVLCIHPAQVAAVNAAFTPTEAEVADARAVLDAWAQAGRSGVVRLGERMIDAPVVSQAKRVLARAGP
jgi:citrate lyase subunit beta/citryl-CoA lyase